MAVRLLTESLERTWGNRSIGRMLYAYSTFKLTKTEVDLCCRAWQEDPIACVIVTSLEILNNLYILLGQDHWQWFREIPMILIGKRMLDRARSLAVQKIVLSEGAGDEFLLQALKVLLFYITIYITCFFHVDNVGRERRCFI